MISSFPLRFLASPTLHTIEVSKRMQETARMENRGLDAILEGPGSPSCGLFPRAEVGIFDLSIDIWFAMLPDLAQFVGATKFDQLKVNPS